MNVSFSKLTEQDCEECKKCKQHGYSLRSCESETGEETGEKTCKVCEENKPHLERARISREVYRKDASLNTSSEETYFLMDIPKVLMLPNLLGTKTTLFTRRIIMNQSIAPLGSFKKINGTHNNNINKAVGFLWREAIQGHRDKDVASVVITFLREP